MNLKCKLILEDYRKQKEHFVALGSVVHDILSNIAKELGINGANNTEVNCKIASQGEAKYSKETMNRKHRFVNPQESENHRY